MRNSIAGRDWECQNSCSNLQHPASSAAHQTVSCFHNLLRVRKASCYQLASHADVNVCRNRMIYLEKHHTVFSTECWIDPYEPLENCWRQHLCVFYYFLLQSTTSIISSYSLNPPTILTSLRLKLILVDCMWSKQSWLLPTVGDILSLHISVSN